MARKDEAVRALADLGLTPAEAEAYCQLVRSTADGPVSGYRIAKELGRDPANMSKTLAALESRGAVRVEQEKPRLFRPVPPEDFTEDLVRHVRQRRHAALAILADLGDRVAEDGLYTLRDREQVLARARDLVVAARSVVLIEAGGDAGTPLLSACAEAARRGVQVLILSARPLAAPAGVRVVLDPDGDVDLANHPGAWLELVADGGQVLRANFRADASGEVLQAYWSRSPFVGHATHRSLGRAMAAAATATMADQGMRADEVAVRRVRLRSRIAGLVDFSGTWRALGLPAVDEPAGGARPVTLNATITTEDATLAIEDAVLATQDEAIVNQDVAIVNEDVAIEDATRETESLATPPARVPRPEPRPRSDPAAFEPTPFADPDAHLASRSARPHRPGGENDAGAAAPDEDSDTDVTEGLRYVYRKRKGEAS